MSSSGPLRRRPTADVPGLKDEIIVLGAGMAGIATALALQARGCTVALVDRKAPGRETSFGNAGVIQAEAVEPYAFPRGIGNIVRIAFGQGNAVSYHLSAVAAQARPLWHYWRASSPARHRAISQTYARLIRRATSDHAPLIDASGAGNLIRKDGFFQVHSNAASFADAARMAERLQREHGVPSSALSGEDMRRSEPALLQTPAGAIRWHDSWTCTDPGALVAGYAELFRRRGGSLAEGDAFSLHRDGAGWAVATSGGHLRAAQAVIALGPWSGQVLKPFGYRPLTVLKRGYHRQYAGGALIRAPLVLADDGLVLAPMRDGLRLTTGAEIGHPDAPQTPRQLQRAEARVAQLLGSAPGPGGPPWMGTRPCMADMLPVVGPAPRHPGLWFNFGHGHQGFTLGPTTAALLAEAMLGTPEALPSAVRPDGRV